MNHEIVSPDAMQRSTHSGGREGHDRTPLLQQAPPQVDGDRRAWPGPGDRQAPPDLSGCATKAEAREILQKLLRELEDGIHVAPSETTLEEYLTSWLEDVARHRVTARSLDRYRSIVRVQLIPALGGVKLTSLRPDQVQHLYSDLMDAKLSAATIQKVHTVLHGSLRHAVAMRMLPRNPADNMALPRIRRREMTALSEEEIGKLLAAAEGTPVAVPLLCLVTLGVRRGELLGLTWPDVDFEQGQVSVRRTLEESSAGVILKEPKTARATRSLALPQITAEALREHRKVQLETRLRVGPGFNAAELVFPGADGELWWSSNFARACRRVFDDAGLFGVAAARPASHARDDALARRRSPQGGQRTPRAQLDLADSGRLQPRDARHAGRGGREDRRRTQSSTSRLKVETLSRGATAQDGGVVGTTIRVRRGALRTRPGSTAI